MNHSIIQRTALAALLASAVAAPVFAAEPSVAPTNPAYDTYRHVVLGDTHAAVANQSSFDEFSPRQLTAGYARYLLNNGQSAWSVQQTVASSNDVAVYRAASTDDSRFSAYQLYQRSLGQDVPAAGDPLSASSMSGPPPR